MHKRRGVRRGAFRAGSKVIWVIVIAVTGFIGSIVYMVMGRPRTA